MCIRRSVLFGLVAVSLLATSTTHADDFDRHGPYLGVNAAYGIDLLATEFASIAGVTVPISYDNSWGLNARAGYRALSWLALEIEYEWMKGIGVNTGPVPIATFRPHTLTGNLKLILPIWRVQPYLLAGAGVSIFTVEYNKAIIPLPDTSGTGFGFRGGAGVDLYLTKNVAFNAEGTAVLNTSDFNASAINFTTSLYYFSLSAGLTYRF